MKQVSWSILIWCLLAAFASCVISATLASNSDGQTKQNVALQKRDLCVFKRSFEVPQQENMNMETMSSDHLSGRGKRGCRLLTCSVHDLAYRINQLSNKMNNVPLHKISPCGYGRRRRHSSLQRSIMPTPGEVPSET